MEACFQVSTFATATKACIINSHPPYFFSKEKLNLPTCKGFNKATSLSSSSSTSSSSIAAIICEGRRSRIICKAQNTTNEGNYFIYSSIKILMSNCCLLDLAHSLLQILVLLHISIICSGDTPKLPTTPELGKILVDLRESNCSCFNILGTWFNSRTLV